MLKFLKYMAIILGILGLLVVGYISYLRVVNYINCPTEQRIGSLSAPSYPNVTQIITSTMTFYSGGTSGKQIFLTSDTPETVMSFFKTTLTGQGWRAVRQELDSRGYQLISFQETRQLPVYYVRVYTNPTEQGTVVEVYLASDERPCIAY